MSKSCAKDCALPKGAFPVKFKVKSPVHALQLARQLIRPFKHWTVGRLATNDVDHNQEVHVKSPQAEAFCALGALQRVNTRHQEKAQEFLELAAARLFRPDDDLKYYRPDEDDIFEVNDVVRNAKTHARVLLMFRKAIALAKRAQERRK